MQMLSKERKFDKSFKLRLQNAAKAVIEYYVDIPDNPLGSKKILFVVDIIEGISSLVKGDLQGIKPLAIKMGGYPSSLDKLEQFVKLIKQNKSQISAKQVGGMIAANAGAIIDAIPLGMIPGGDKIGELIKQGMEDPASLFDPKTLFGHFSNSKGTMGFDEFNSIFTQLGIKIPHARMLQIFSAADREKKGELKYQDFVKSLESLKGFLINEIMEQMGFSIRDMAISFAFSITILILMFAFIFVGIEAFAPSSSFSSVTNSMLPLGAGGSVNKGEEEKKPEELAAAADEKMA
jgi:hypothetical protein